MPIRSIDPLSARPFLPKLERLALVIAPLLLSGCVGEQTGDDEQTDATLTYQDSDGDTIIDVHEGPADTDGDGALDYLDRDSDGDGIPDSVEAGDVDPLTFPIDSDGDGQPDYRDRDSDGNGIPDQLEAGGDPSAPLDLDGDGIMDFRDSDNDGDTLLDAVEIGPAQPLDTDGDGLSDYLDLDSDHDQILDREEAGLAPDGRPRDTDLDDLPDYRDADSDGDGFSDLDESGDTVLETAPRDTDQDGAPDFIDGDSDGDALSDADEAQYGTDPYKYDTDGDTYSDGGEVAAGSSPSSSESIPSGLYIVVPQRSVTSESFTFTTEIGRADLVFVLDTTGSMGPTLTSLATDFTTVVQEVSSIIPDAAFGVVTFKDYNASGMGSGGDRPFVLEQQVTTRRDRVQEVLNGLRDGSGGDLPESAMEALYQSASGQGFDQDCDLAWDTNTDVAPFLASAQDVFQGTVDGSYDSSDTSTGLLGGVGIRQYALPLFVWTTDTDFRDPDDGEPAAGSCENAAGEGRVVSAMNALGGKLLGINAGSETGLTEQMIQLAGGTSSYADLDGDGELDPLVFSSQGGREVVDAVVQGVTALHLSGEFQKVELRVDGDVWGFVRDVEPPLYTDVRPGDALNFSISLYGASPATADDQIFTLTLVVVGDGSTSLDSRQILIVVPGSAHASE